MRPRSWQEFRPLDSLIAVRYGLVMVEAACGDSGLNSRDDNIKGAVSVLLEDISGHD